MPGVPPDALSQVKRGLKGLFSRKKRDRYQRTDELAGGPSTGASYGPPEITTADNEYQQTLTGPHSSIPQIAEPANVEQSKNIDLDPYASSTRPVSAEPSVQEGSMAKLDAKLPADGMSATSGPLSDDLSGIYGSPLASPMDSKQQELPKWEGLCPVEKEGSVAEAREGDQDVEAATERDAITQRQDMDKGIPTEPATEGVSPADVQDMEEAVSGEPAD